ncbi:unnamed protein product [Rotaria sp. Silwood1]|nr:unnamed protein product [Rotaria sp. Silwood1]CAF1432350.1 unnamed protein product [Rotaria sp. Silwood1]CAF3686400.1 unnamed protein product [Rotaria sp. Silwood1]
MLYFELNENFWIKLIYLRLDRRDSTSLRFYLGKELRQYDIGYFTFGLIADPTGIAIPPRVNEFVIDSYCPAIATKNFPESGITVISAFPHTHLQGKFNLHVQK